MIKKRKTGKFIFLNIITLGIYGLVFWTKWADDLNKICEGDEKDSANYILVFLLDLFSLGIYSLAWNCQMGERMFQKGQEYGVEIKHGGMFMLLMRILPIASSVFKIKYINKLAEVYNSNLEEKAE